MSPQVIKFNKNLRRKMELRRTEIKRREIKSSEGEFILLPKIVREV
jgi:hypothetical protein